MEHLIYFDIIGTIAFALSGYILASKANLDILGVLVVSYITAFGGGVVRDLLADRMPFIFSETYPISIVFMTIVGAYLFKVHKHTKLTDNRLFMISDSIGLSVFALTGAIVGVKAGFNFGGVVFLAFLTAVGGGIIRDMIMNKVPYVLVSEFYGTVAIVIGIMVWGASKYSSLTTLSILLILVTGFVLRMLAIKFKWKLPHLMEN